MALLDYFAEKDCVVLTTTHQNLLKNYAATRDRAENASVEFDAETLQPTYRLILGFPGESHAIDIAVNSGLDDRVVRTASDYLHSGRTDVSELIRNLNEKNRELTEKETDLNRRAAELESRIAAAEEERKSLAAQTIDLKKEGIRDLNILLSESRKTLENLVKQVKETAASPQSRKEVKTFLEEMAGSVSSQSEELEQEEEQLRELPDAPVLEGAQVKIRRTGKTGTVVRKDKSGSWIVETGSVKISMREEEFVPVQKGKEEKLKIDTGGIVPSSKAHFELDLRGFRLEEALAALEKQIDSCLISGLYEFSIIHGHGEGILQRGVHQFLSASRQVGEYHFAHPEQGGFGKTHVVLHRA
jgi:DNA mismatch repair protein MutS2